VRVRHNRVRPFLAAVLTAGLALAMPGGAAERARVTVLLSSDAEPYRQVLAGIRQQLASGVDFDVQTLGDDAAKAKSIIEKTKGAPPALYFTVGSAATQLAIRHGGGAPVVAGLILNAAEIDKAPQATGVILEFPPEVQLEWLRRLLPAQRDIGVLYSDPQILPGIENTARRGEALGLRVHVRRVESSRNLPEALDSLENRIGVLMGVADPGVLNPMTAKPILLFSFRNRIPLVGLSEQWVKAGALYALGRDYVDIGRQCAEIAARILAGTPVSDIPPQPPRKVAYAINAKTARHMKIDIPERLLLGAQRVVD
jgi:putative ABC transport system substrate-binding protein